MKLAWRLSLLVLTSVCVTQGPAWGGQSAAGQSGVVMRDVPARGDPKSRYLFYLPGRIVEAGNIRPTDKRFGVYEYEQILETLKQRGFVVISEARTRDTDIEQYAVKIAGQVRQLVKAGVPPRHITVVGASQGSWIAMLAATHLKDRELNFVVLAGCAAEDDFLKLVNLHGKVLSIYERSDLAGSCRKFRDDATGLSSYKEVEISTGLRHGFLYRPIREWIEPTVEWAAQAP